MPRKYNLRKRDETVKWVEDETLKDEEEEEEEEDEEYEPTEEEEETEVEESVEENSKPSGVIQIPMPKKGVRITIEIDGGGDDYDMANELDELEEEEEEADGFIGYLMNKYVPASKLKKNKKKEGEEGGNTPALELNEQEQDYYDELSKAKQKKLNKQMKQLSSLVSQGDVPYKFRVLDLPVSDTVKASVIKKIDVLTGMGDDSSESYKLRTWVEGFLRIPFGVNVPLPVKLADGAKPCSQFLAESRKTLDKAVYGMNGAKTQIMQILAQWISNPDSVGNVIALRGPMGVGKCHAKDTPILMYDGSIKLVQDIQIGDMIMGDDSTPRTVTNLGRGRDMMYDIIPTKGEKYTVNSEHILCLKQSGIGCIKQRKTKNNEVKFQSIKLKKESLTLDCKQFDDYEEAYNYLTSNPEKETVFEISVKDYLKLPKDITKNWLKGYKVGVTFPTKQVPFDPYILGLWLGDGSSHTTMISSQDAVILGYLHKNLPKYGLMLNWYSKYDYRIRGIEKGDNKMLDVLNQYNMLNNKHIPFDYKVNDRETRLKILAGLIDTDGYLIHNVYEITQKSKQLADDIVYIARSLGFMTTRKEVEKSCMYNGEKQRGIYHRIFISGDISEIPVLCERKKAHERYQEKNPLVSALEVKCIGEGDYYGFTLDGNHRYLMGDFTVTHNTSFAKHGVANVLKRPFEFFSLGGAADSSNFVGHSYTYEGSAWGRVADSLMNARCMNPVMYFDELDKVSETAHGQEIVSMLIHMTDRTQNSQFHDRYFAGVDINLSQCLFVFSFNDESKVHPILKDRMQVIQCSGYNAEEKKIILTQYVWPQIMERIKLEQLTITDEAIKYLIEQYSKEEEGVRTLMRAVETLLMRINLLRIADEETAKSYPFYTKIKLPCEITPDLAKHILQDVTPAKDDTWKSFYV